MDPIAHSYQGSCHCGAIGFTYRTEQDPGHWAIRACQCSFCRLHQALSTSDPKGTLEFQQHEAGWLQCYRFGQQTADFLICGRCGVYVGALIETPLGRFGIINTRTLQPMPPHLALPLAMDYDAESTVQRIARREQRWSPVTGAAISQLIAAE
jgi:hypothetical protein